MSANLAIPGIVLKGRNGSNKDARAKVWATNPDNPKRVLLWAKSGRFSWNNVSSLDINYELAPADEPTWPDPTREPPPDVPRGSKRPQTPVESIAAAPEPMPTVDTSADDDQGEEAVPEEAPSPPPAPEPPAPETVIVLRGEAATSFNARVLFLSNVARMTGGSPLAPSELVTVAVDRLVAGMMGGAL